jgi:hypothetical protein
MKLWCILHLNKHALPILFYFRNKELEDALLQECDFGSLRNICKGRPVPQKHRADVWQVMKYP